MRHLTLEQRSGLCSLLGLKPFPIPLSLTELVSHSLLPPFRCRSNFPFSSSAPSLETSQYFPLTAETACDCDNCLCAAICSILTGWNSQASILEELLVKHRHDGPHSHLYL